jgi:hypothetical protein
MKTAIAGTALLVLVAISVTPAAAKRHLSPAGDFTAAGKVSGTRNGSLLVPCQAHLTGSVDESGIGQVTGGSFTGKEGCDQLSLDNLPWKMAVKGKQKVRVMNVTFDRGTIAFCGPSNVSVKLKNGLMTLTDAPMAGDCSISAHLVTSPPLSIVH